MTLVIRFLHRIGSSITVDLVRTFAVVEFYVCPDTFSEFTLGTVVVAIKLLRFECFEKCLVSLSKSALKTIFIKPIAIFHKKVYNILTTEQTGACRQAERKV